jgi:hypothetical protein
LPEVITVVAKNGILSSFNLGGLVSLVATSRHPISGTYLNLFTLASSLFSLEDAEIAGKEIRFFSFAPSNIAFVAFNAACLLFAAAAAAAAAAFTFLGTEMLFLLATNIRQSAFLIFLADHPDDSPI